MLVTCFGYTGYRNAKFGQIQVHGQRLAEMAKKHSSEAFCAFDDLSEAAVFSVLVEFDEGAGGVWPCHLNAALLEVDRMMGAEAAASTDSATDLDSRGVEWDGRLAQAVKSMSYSQFD